MASVNQTRPHCVNQMGKTHSKPLAAQHGRGMAWARHAMCESALKEMLHSQSLPLHVSQSPQFRSLLSRFPSKSLYKERDAAVQLASLTCLR